MLLRSQCHAAAEVLQPAAVQQEGTTESLLSQEPGGDEKLARQLLL